MKTYICIVASIVLFTSIFFSCKKNKNNPTQDCMLSSFTDSTTSVQSVTEFTYNESGKLSTVIVTGQNACKRTFQYFGNTIIFSVADTTPGILNEVDTIVLNSAGLIQTQVAHYPTTGSVSVETFFYDETGQTAISSTETENGVPGDTIIYSTVNGDLMYEKVKGQTIDNNDFIYYTENIVQGDPTNFRQLLYYGAYYYKNKHLLNVLYSPGVSYKAYTYSFTDNRIATATMRKWQSGSSDTVTHIMSYSYSCK